MSNTNTKTRPTHRIFSVMKNGEAKKSVWTAIGGAWPNADGKGFNLKYDALPLPGAEIVLRLIEDEEKAA